MRLREREKIEFVWGAHCTVRESVCVNVLFVSDIMSVRTGRESVSRCEKDNDKRVSNASDKMALLSFPPRTSFRTN